MPAPRPMLDDNVGAISLQVNVVRLLTPMTPPLPHSPKSGPILRQVIFTHGSETGPYCWGENGHGQLGNGVDGGSKSTPSVLDTQISFRKLSPSVFVACALGTDNLLYCWGENGLAVDVVTG